MSTSKSSSGLLGDTSTDRSVYADSPHHTRVTESDSSQHSAPHPPTLPPPPPPAQPTPSQIQGPTQFDTEETLYRNPEILFSDPLSSTPAGGSSNFGNLIEKF